MATTPDLEASATPLFSQPFRQISQMLLVLVAMASGCYVIYPALEPVILANPFLNGVIIAVFVVGVIACFVQVFQLSFSVRWIERFIGEGAADPADRPPRLLATLASLLRDRGKKRQISSASADSILDSIATRIEEARDITRYLVSLLIFLGLLGTFYGLATTVPAVVETIRSLAPQEGEGNVDIFARLMTGLEKQLGGMGTAFGSSLLGLAGSLIVGLLELLASRGQNRFYRELEEWLSSFTRLGLAGSEGDQGGEVGHLYAVLDYMGEQMEAMRAMFAQSDARMTEVAASVGDLTQTLAAADRGSEALGRIADSQEALIDRFGPRGEGELGGGEDAESRMRLRSIDVQLLRILEELSAGRQETLAELRSDLGALTRELRKGGGGGRVASGASEPATPQVGGLAQGGFGRSGTPKAQARPTAAGRNVPWDTPSGRQE